MVDIAVSNHPPFVAQETGVQLDEEAVASMHTLPVGEGWSICKPGEGQQVLTNEGPTPGVTPFKF